MAKQQQDKEDILREATALVNRIEIKFSRDAVSKESVFVGFRRDGAISFFFGAEPVYQFNTRHEFRRGYCQGTMLKAVEGKIIQLTRIREGEQLVLLSRDYSDQQTAVFLQEMKHALLLLFKEIKGGRWSILGAVVEAGSAEELLQRVADWLEQHTREIQIADAPNVAGSSAPHFRKP